MSRWILITGAAQRVGRVIALEMAAAGWNVAVHYNSSAPEALETANEIRERGVQACLVEADLANAKLVEQIIPSLAAEFGPFDALVNNASLFVPDDMDASGAKHKAINAEAPRILSEGFARHAAQDRTSVIVNILDTDPSVPEFSHYNESKRVLAAMTLEMAKRFAPRVRVNGVAPGPVLRNPRQSEAHFATRVTNTPLGKPMGPEMVSSAVRFLIDNAAVTGTIIPVDGGIHLKSGKA